ncbi:CBS domain-containing protein [Gracilibacillus sp. YIM 98692]|uniref:CBS domain-containing protein n=1 Tax=Gracilibacillus sp. YIM 98692 TaxID=2663532 RepID=UPI0013D65F2B|nr:CBS domain-containing protein [Gracilibacillus sp. YIM 98692]
MNSNKHQLSTRFEVAFNQIHDLLCKYAKETNTNASFHEVLSKAKTHHIVKSHYELLKQCSKLRNAMVHRKIKEEFYIAEPHEEVVLELEKLKEILSKPPQVLSIASQPVQYFKQIDTLEDVLTAFHQDGFTQYPIYDQQTYIGLLTEGGIARFLAHYVDQISTMNTKKIQVEELLSYEKENSIAFMKQDSNLFDLEAIFHIYHQQNKKLEAIIITEDGSQNQLPIGIVSAWDLLKVPNDNFTLIRHT